MKALAKQAVLVPKPTFYAKLSVSVQIARGNSPDVVVTLLAFLVSQKAVSALL